MIDFFDRKQITEVSGAVQLSSIFSLKDRTLAILTDTAENWTTVSDVPSVLGEEAGLLLRGQEANAGSPVSLDVGSKVEGYGVFTFPYGPVTYGVPEAGGFKLITYGERIVKIIPQINFKKRCVESNAVGRMPEDVLLQVERSAGNFSASYSTCFVTAVEDALGLEVPSQAKWTRAVAIELERIYNHLYVFGRLAEAASQNVATNQTNALRENVLRLNSRYFGHRYLFGLNAVGGVRIDLSKGDRLSLYAATKQITDEFSDLVDYFLESRIFLDRLQSTAKLSKSDALNLGAVGPSARGSGIEWDDRLAYPIEPYGDIYEDIEIDTGEDTMARTMVRLKEIQTSIVILKELLDRMPSDGVKAPDKAVAKGKSADEFSLCRIESPSGDLIQVVQLNQNGQIEHLHIRPASLVNWLPFAKSLENNVFTDFQFAYESFGFSYADSDR
jgi:Ni,Fe-hydrogenase III large subunit